METKKLKKILAIIFCICLAIYFAYAVILLIIHPTEIYVITKGEIKEEEETVGYIIRNETVIKDEDNLNGIYAITTEGQKVAKDEVVFRYYKESEKETTENIKKIDYEIQEELEKDKTSPSSADIKVIENQIEEKLIELNKLTNYQEIKEYKDNIDELISKKIKYIGENTSDKNIKQLIKEREEYEKKLTNGALYKKSPASGTVSYRVDGLEEKLTPENLGEITDTFLEGLDLKTGQIISSSSDCGKIIDNFKYYIAITTNSELGNNAKVGDSVTLRLSGTEEEKADIVQINEESGKKTIIFEVDRMSTTVINHRKIAVDIIWWEKAGFKVPNQAIYSETINNNEINYVIKNKSGIESKSYVKIQKQNENFSIISSYETKELQELGVSEEDIKNCKKIVNYDEIVLKKQK